MPRMTPKSESRALKGWGQIAEFLGQTPSVAQRWQNEGMPVTREGRFVYASPADLTVRNAARKSQFTWPAKARICWAI
jgi:hypothetical protein